MKISRMLLLMMFSICLQHLHVSTSNSKKTIESVDTVEEQVHTNGVNPVDRHGAGGAHGGGGHGGSAGGGGDPGVVIPYAGAGAHRSPAKNHHGLNSGEHNSTGLPQLVSVILGLVLLLTYCS